MRVYELARDLGLESKDVLARVHELGIEAKTASSGISDDDAALVRLSYDEEKAPPPPAPVAVPEVPAELVAEVVAADEEEEPEAEPAKAKGRGRDRRAPEPEAPQARRAVRCDGLAVRRRESSDLGALIEGFVGRRWGQKVPSIRG